MVTVRVTGNTMGSVNVSLIDTGGSTLASSTSSGASFNLAQKTLAAAGTYTININPQGSNVGTLNITVTSP